MTQSPFDVFEDSDFKTLPDLLEAGEAAASVATGTDEPADTESTDDADSSETV